MEPKQQQDITERLILLMETSADLRIKLETALTLLNGSKCALYGAQEAQWVKMYAELLEEVAK
jgi:hypothetical protein